MLLLGGVGFFWGGAVFLSAFCKTLKTDLNNKQSKLSRSVKERGINMFEWKRLK